jgi:hypothetical protein
VITPPTKARIETPSTRSKTGDDDSVRFDDAYEVGNPAKFKNQYEEIILPQVTAVAEKCSVFWIGVSSSGEQGMKNRWNAKYRTKEKMEHMQAVLSTGWDTTHEVENDLISAFRNDPKLGPKLQNKLGGDQRGAEGAPRFVVYVAWR